MQSIFLNIRLHKDSITDLLNQNLNFSVYLDTTLKKDLESFNRKIKLKAFSHNRNEQKQETKLAIKEPSIKSKTNWELKKNDHTVETLKINYVKII